MIATWLPIEAGAEVEVNTTGRTAHVGRLLGVEHGPTTEQAALLIEEAGRSGPTIIPWTSVASIRQPIEGW